MQDKIKINNTVIYQPDGGISYKFATTSTEDSGRTQDGIMHNSVMFTVEQLEFKATGVPVADVVTILQEVAKRQKFLLHYPSMYYGTWRDDYFYVAEGDLSILSIEEGFETADISFNMTGVNPL